MDQNPAVGSPRRWWTRVSRDRGARTTVAVRSVHPWPIRVGRRGRAGDRRGVQNGSQLVQPAAVLGLPGYPPLAGQQASRAVGFSRARAVAAVTELHHRPVAVSERTASSGQRGGVPQASLLEHRNQALVELSLTTHQRVPRRAALVRFPIEGRSRVAILFRHVWSLGDFCFGVVRFPPRELLGHWPAHRNVEFARTCGAAVRTPCWPAAPASCVPTVPRTGRRPRRAAPRHQPRR